MDRNTHYRLALKEARGMARSKQKRKTSRIICHHLLKMLEDDAPHPIYQHQLYQHQIQPQQIYPHRIDLRKADSDEPFRLKSDKKSKQYSFDF